MRLRWITSRALLVRPPRFVRMNPQLIGGAEAFVIAPRTTGGKGPARVVERISATGLLAQLLPLATYARGRLKFAECCQSGATRRPPDILPRYVLPELAALGRAEIPELTIDLIAADIRRPRAGQLSDCCSNTSSLRLQSAATGPCRLRRSTSASTPQFPAPAPARERGHRQN